MHVEANRSPYLNPAERVRGDQRTQQPQAAGRTDFARHAEAARPASPVRPTPLAAEGLASGGVGQPPTPRLGDAGGFRPPELIAARYEGQDRSLTPEGGLRSGGAGSHGLRPDTEDLPRGLRQLVEVQAMSQPDVLGRGGRLDLTI